MDTADPRGGVFPAPLYREASALKRCVYTVLTGGYESLNEQTVARESALPFICFTDTPELTSETWQIRPLTQVFAADDIRNQRTHKLQPHRLLPDFDESLYIDNSVLLRVPPEQIFAAADLSSGLCLPEHSFRATVMDEFAAVAEDGLDDPARITEQLRDYRRFSSKILMAKPYWTAILLRRHDHKSMIAAMEIWLAHVYRYSRRDQLSANMAFHLAELSPGILKIDNHASRFHEWPVIPHRKTARRLWAGDTSAADEVKLHAEIAQLQDQLTRLTQEHQAILATTTWRMLARVRSLLQRLRGGI